MFEASLRVVKKNPESYRGLDAKVTAGNGQIRDGHSTED